MTRSSYSSACQISRSGTPFGVSSATKVAVSPGRRDRANTSAPAATRRSSENPRDGVTARMRGPPRSGFSNPEPGNWKCGATRRRSICSCELFESANTAHRPLGSSVSVVTSMVWTVPSSSGAVVRVTTPGNVSDVFRSSTMDAISRATSSGSIAIASSARAGSANHSARTTTANSTVARRPIFNRSPLTKLRLRIVLPTGSFSTCAPLFAQEAFGLPCDFACIHVECRARLKPRPTARPPSRIRYAASSRSASGASRAKSR